MGDREEIRHGWHDGFHWLWSPDGGVTALLKVCPEIVLGQPVMVTDYHGAVPSPRPEETSKGWRDLGHCVFNPSLPKAEDLVWADECEIYVLMDASEPEEQSLDFNSGTFTLCDPKDALPYQETWDRRGIAEQRERLRLRQAEFWAAMRGLGAESYIGVGDYAGFTFATRRQDHFEALLKALTPLSP